MSKKPKSIPERLTWAASLVDAQVNDRILEIGCGAGLFAGLLAARLDGGYLQAIDRSFPMAEKARIRNKRHVEAGRMSIANVDIGQFECAGTFDKIIAFNVGFFRQDSPTELDVIRRLLGPRDRLFVFYQAPYNLDRDFADSIAANLTKNSYSVEDTILQRLHPTYACCVIASPKPARP